MSTSVDKQQASGASTVPPTPSRAGRRKNNTLTQLDEVFEGECQAERDAASSSSSKRPAKDQGQVKAKKKKARETREEKESSSNDDSDPSESEGNSSASSSDGSVQSDQPKKLLKKTGFIGFKGVGIISPDSKARLRKIQRLLEGVANIIPKIDHEGKDALRTFAAEVAEFRDFVKELISSIRSEVPDLNPMKKRVVKQLKSLRDVLVELHEDVDPNSEMPMMGNHLLDWSDVEDLKAILGTKTARRLRTSLKGQKRLFKPIFRKSPADIARTWLSQQERRKSNYSSGSASFNRDARPRNSDRGGPSKNTGFGGRRGGKR
jgi:hypothetical protein